MPAPYTLFRTYPLGVRALERPTVNLQRARALARFHSYSRPVTTSRIIRPSGITNDVEGTPQAPPPLLCTPVLPPPYSLIVPVSLPPFFTRATSFSLALCPIVCRGHGESLLQRFSALRSLSPAGCRVNPAKRRFNWIVRTPRQKPTSKS